MAIRNGGFRRSRALRPSLSVRVLHAVLAVFLLWFLGFLVYAGTIPAKLKDNESVVDGIIVLTGGSERLAEGMRLLKRGMAQELFVSGVAEGVDKAALLQTLDLDDRPDMKLTECCVSLGHSALSTSDNAAESRDWVQSRHVHSIRLVTANYHINRSLLEFHRAMPWLQVIPNPVFPREVLDPYWFTSPRTIWLLINEYNKTVASIGYAVAGNFIDRVVSAWSHFRQWVW